VVELSAIADGRRIRIEESAGRPFAARIEVEGRGRYRLLDLAGAEILGWGPADRPAEITSAVVLELEPSQG
jgi:hypothetical protein